MCKLAARKNPITLQAEGSAATQIWWIIELRAEGPWTHLASTEDQGSEGLRDGDFPQPSQQECVRDQTKPLENHSPTLLAPCLYTLYNPRENLNVINKTLHPNYPIIGQRHLLGGQLSLKKKKKIKAWVPSPE